MSQEDFEQFLLGEGVDPWQEIQHEYDESTKRITYWNPDFSVQSADSERPTA